MINQTLAFGPSELSSLVPCAGTCSKNAGEPPRQINYADLSQNCSAISGYQYFSNDPQNDINNRAHTDPCHPVVAVPTAVLNLHPEWHNCLPNAVGGFYDPPIALVKQTALVPGQQAAPTPASPIPAPPIETGVPTKVLPSINVLPSNNALPSTNVTKDLPWLAFSIYALQPVSSLLPPSTSVRPDPAFMTMGTHVILALPSQVIAIGSTTLSAGGPGTTISGTHISVAPSGNLVVGSSTVAIPMIGARLGGIIHAAFGGGIPSVSSVLAFAAQIGVPATTGSQGSKGMVGIDAASIASTSTGGGSAPLKSTGPSIIANGNTASASNVLALATQSGFPATPGSQGSKGMVGIDAASSVSAPLKSTVPSLIANGNTVSAITASFTNNVGKPPTNTASTSPSVGSLPPKSNPLPNTVNAITPLTAAISPPTNFPTTSPTTILAFTSNANTASTLKVQLWIGLWISALLVSLVVPF